MLAGGKFDPTRVDAKSRARVIALHTWLGSQDGDQVLVSMLDGSVCGIDYAAAFTNVTPITDPVLTIGRIDAIPADACKTPACIDPTIAAVEAVTDDHLLDMASDMPVIEGDPWYSGVDNRLQIVRWLSTRRTKVVEALTAWARA